MVTCTSIYLRVNVFVSDCLWTSSGNSAILLKAEAGAKSSKWTEVAGPDKQLGGSFFSF